MDNTQLNSFLLLPLVEIEIRLGTLGKHFDSNIDKKYFLEIKQNLENATNVFKTVEKTNTVEYINNNLKLITCSGKEQKLIMKENVFTKTIQMSNSPFDVRLSINQEFSLKSYIPSFQKENANTRKKERTSFIDTNYRYDLTHVIETINGITKEKYEIEIEILVTKETLSWKSKYINDFIECKIYDLINVVEPIERESFKITFF
jgi:hypothetical protein